MTKTLLAVVLALGALVAPTTASAKTPDVIPLPDGFQPEGIASGRGHSFYVGSIPTGAIYKGSYRTGRGEILVPAQEDRSAIGIEVDRRNRIFVAGGNNVGNTKGIWIYDARTGAEVAAYEIPQAGFINDVVVTRRAAYFTDSLRQVFYTVPLGKKGAPGALVTTPITGEFVYGPGFNANGIEWARKARRLVMIQSSTGSLFSVDPQTGASERIPLASGESLPNGDGLLFRGRTLYVVQNQRNQVASVRLADDLSSGTVLRRVTHPLFHVPTTIAAFGSRLYVVNAQFGTTTEPYEVVKVPRR